MLLSKWINMVLNDHRNHKAYRWGGWGGGVRGMAVGGEGDYKYNIPIATLSSQEWLLHQDGQRWDYISNFLSLVLSVLDDIDRADCTQPSKVTGILFVAEARKVILLGVAHHQKITLSSPKYHLLTCICYSSILTFSGICEWIQLRACAGKKAGERETQRGRERRKERVIYHYVKLERLGNTLILVIVLL